MVGVRCSKKVLLCLSVLAVTADTACARFLSARDGRCAPRARTACYASSTPGVRYPDPARLGRHSYTFSFRERNGIVYTCRGGHIDITHLRKNADWTAHLAWRIRKVLLSDEPEFRYRMREPSLYYVHFDYPTGWTSLPEHVREQIATEVAIAAAQYCTYTGTTWHEIVTWFGFKGVGVYPEYPSAFGWEDLYSNLLGCRLAGEALRDPDREFGEAMTSLIDREMQVLGAQPRPAAWEAGEAVRDQWFFKGFFSCDMVRRNFDAGQDDGMVTPWLIPGIGSCKDETAQSYPVPDLALVSDYGFSVRLEIEPHEWERWDILRIVESGTGTKMTRIEPARHFGMIIEGIRARAIERYGPYADQPVLLPDEARQMLASKPAKRENAGAKRGLLDRLVAVIRSGDRYVQAQAAGSVQADLESAMGDRNENRQTSFTEVLTLAASWLDEKP